MEYDVFVSHSSKDKTIVDAICNVLENNNIRCWIAPRDIRPGKTWASEIGRGIKNSQAILLLYSKNANNSEAVSNEIDIAFSNNKTIIPFLIDNTPMNEDFNFYLNRKHWLVAYPDYKKKFPELITSICHILDREEKFVPTETKTIFSRLKFIIIFTIVFVILAISFMLVKSNIFTPVANNNTEIMIADSIQLAQHVEESEIIEEGNKTDNQSKVVKDPIEKKIETVKKPPVDTPPPKPNQTVKIVINGQLYEGAVNDNKQPDGSGIMYYSRSGSIKIGYRDLDVNTGYKFVGEWSNGEIVRGVLYDKSEKEIFKN